MLGLIFGYNGLDRLSGGGGPGGGGGGIGFSGSAGIGRLFNDQMGGQISWLLPFAAVGLVAGLWARRGTPRTDRMRAAYLLWGGWALTHALVFSYMTGIVHTYYTVAMAPAVGALVGMGGVELWRMRERPSTRWALSLAIAASGVWAYVLLERTPDFAPGLSWLVLIASLARRGGAAGGRRAAAPSRRPGRRRRAPRSRCSPARRRTRWTPSDRPTRARNPSAGPTVVAAGGPGGCAMGGGPQGGPAAPPPTASRLQRRPRPARPRPQGALPADRAAVVGGGGASANATWSTSCWPTAGRPAGSRPRAAPEAPGPAAAGRRRAGDVHGRFNGGDPSPTLAEFVALVKSGDLRFYVGGGMGGGGLGGRDGDSTAIQAGSRSTAPGGLGERGRSDGLRPLLRGGGGPRRETSYEARRRRCARIATAVGSGAGMTGSPPSTRAARMRPRAPPCGR